VLISSNFVFKVCDFGMGRKMDGGSDGGADSEDGTSEYYQSGNAKIFPLRWTAPEAFTDSKYSQATDVWSWAVLAYEVFSLGQRPYSDWTDKEVWIKVKDGERLARPTDFCTKDTWDRFILPCFASDPAQRPSFAALLESLEKELGANMQAGTLKLLTQSSAAGADGRKSWFGSSSMWSGSSSAPLNSAGTGSGGATMATLGGGAGDQGGHYYQYTGVQDAAVFDGSQGDADTSKSFDFALGAGSKVQPASQAGTAPQTTSRVTKWGTPSQQDGYLDVVGDGLDAAA
jgi:serine/threonine protein kinase